MLGDMVCAFGWCPFKDHKDESIESVRSNGAAFFDPTEAALEQSVGSMIAFLTHAAKAAQPVEVDPSTKCPEGEYYFGPADGCENCRDFLCNTICAVTPGHCVEGTPPGNWQSLSSDVGVITLGPDENNLGGLGDSCESSAGCQDGLVCMDGTCRYDPAGECWQDSGCTDGRICSGGKCLVPLGGACEFDADCAAWECRDGFCQTPIIK